MRSVIDWARKDFLALQNGGVDAVMFSNEFSFPYMTKVAPVIGMSMARVIGELMPEIRIPFGVEVIIDPERSVELATAVGAKFIRGIFSSVYASDFGFWDTNSGATVRQKYALGRGDLKMLYNIVPESGNHMQTRDIADIARTTVFTNDPDALCVSGPSAGSEADLSVMRKIKDAVPETLVFANTGVNAKNVKANFAIADGGVVGTTFKVDGKFKNHVDPDRVKELMAVVKSLR
jgi:membrane complex biogenesis BtpA family protein